MGLKIDLEEPTPQPNSTKAKKEEMKYKCILKAKIVGPLHKTHLLIYKTTILSSTTYSNAIFLHILAMPETQFQW